MARKKTDGVKAGDANASDAASPEAEAVTVSDDAQAAPSGADSPETVDAEIVDEMRREDAVADDPVVTSETVDADRTDDEPKKKGGGGFVVGILVLLAVAALLAYLFRDEIFGTDDAEPVETTPGVVVSEAEPFPGNELDGDAPITGEAAPGAREAAIAADVEREGADDAAPNALRARAERLRQQRAERDAETAEATQATGPVQPDAQPATRPRTGFVSPDGDSDMAEAVREARAAQARIRREDAERRAAIASRDTAGRDDAPAATERTRPTVTAPAEAAQDAPPVVVATPTQDTQDQRDQQARDDDPNALPGFTTDTDEDDVARADAAQADADDEASPRRTLRERMAALGRSDELDDQQAGDRQAADDVNDQAQPARPTGRVRPLARPAQDDADDADTDEAERPQAIQPRPPVIATRPGASDGALPDNVATDEELEQRLNAVETDLREALRQDLRAEVRQDVLAEAGERIDQAIRQTETEVARLRAELTEQEQRSDQRIAQLRDRLEVLQSRDATANTRGVLILALSNLRGQLDAGQPFERQLDDVERLAPNVTSLRGARRFAQTGLPTDADLRQAFRDAEREALRREAGEDADGFFAGMWANIKGLFTVREIGATEGADTRAVISRAQAALARGQVGVAVQELDTLDGAAAEAFAPFIEEARAKSTTQLQIQRLERAVLDQPDQPRRGG